MAKKFARIIIAIAGALIGLAATAGADKLLAMMNRLPLHEAVYCGGNHICNHILYFIPAHYIRLFKGSGRSGSPHERYVLIRYFPWRGGAYSGACDSAAFKHAHGKSPLAHRHDYKRCALLRVRLSWLRAGIEAQGRGQSAFVVPPPGQGEQILFRRTSKAA